MDSSKAMSVTAIARMRAPRAATEILAEFSYGRFWSSPRLLIRSFWRTESALGHGRVHDVVRPIGTTRQRSLVPSMGFACHAETSRGLKSPLIVERSAPHRRAADARRHASIGMEYGQHLADVVGLQFLQGCFGHRRRRIAFMRCLPRRSIILSPDRESTGRG